MNKLDSFYKGSLMLKVQGNSVWFCKPNAPQLLHNCAQWVNRSVLLR